VYCPLESVRRAPRRGAVAVWLVVSLAVILGIAAIGMDGGRMMDERQYAQAAADAAALAGGADLYGNYWKNLGTDPGGTARAAALQSAALNGYTNDRTHSFVTVNVPPQSGPFAGQAGYVEVIVESLLTPGFSAAIQPGPLTIRARAVARGQPKMIGLTVLGPAGPGALNTSGLVGLTVDNAPIIVNSNAPNAWTNSSLLSIGAANYDIVGGYQNSGLVLGSNAIHTGVPPVPDPLAGIPAPSLASYSQRSANTMNIGLLQLAVLQPGIYQGGINIGLGGIVLMEPGVYIMNGGGLTVGNGGVLTGTGVMIYNTGGASTGGPPPGPITLNAVGVVALSPPTSGTYQGITIFQDRSVPTPMSLQGINLSIGGTVYAAAAPVTVSGISLTGLVAPAGAFVCWRLTFSGILNGLINLEGNWPRVPDVRLVD
jgi:hypothetical protein